MITFAGIPISKGCLFTRVHAYTIDTMLWNFIAEQCVFSDSAVFVWPGPYKIYSPIIVVILVELVVFHRAAWYFFQIVFMFSIMKEISYLLSHGYCARSHNCSVSNVPAPLLSCLVFLRKKSLITWYSSKCVYITHGAEAIFMITHFTCVSFLCNSTANYY